MGYSDIGCYGSEIPTPNIDSIASRGVQYQNFHAAPTCTPTRAALLTGRNPHRAGFGRVASFDPGFPGYSMEFPDSIPTIASTLRDAGYATFAVGKWHLAREIEQSAGGSKHGWPLQVGFDRYYGFLDGFTNFFHPHQLVEDNHHLDIEEYPDDYYLTDDLTERAVTMIKETKSADSSKPFLLYLAHGAVHAPLQAHESDIAPFRGRYADGWTKIREERFRRQKELGLFPEDAVLADLDAGTARDIPDWDGMSHEEQALAARYMEVYAAMVATVDRSVGTLRDCLEELGEWDNTIFIFMSDNGASSDLGNAGTTRYMDAHGSPVRVDIGTDLANIDLIGGPRLFPHYPAGWALTCNTPFRLYKRFTHSGGHTVPFIISWPDGDLPDPAVRGDYAHVSDLLPTVTELIGLQTHLDHTDLDGVSFAGNLRGETDEPHRVEQLYESNGNRGLYQDGWALVDTFTPLEPFDDSGWELFNLETDRTEAVDLAADEPDRLRAMSRRWEEMAAQGDVFPLEDGSGIMFHQRPDFHRPTESATFWPGIPTVERIKARDLIWNRSFTVEVDITPTPGAQGIVLSHGDQAAGYVLYVDQGVVSFALNAAGVMTVLDAGALGKASHIELQVVCPELDRWDVTILVDGEVRSQRTEIWMRTGLMTPLHGIDIGLNRASPVSWDLHVRRGTFPWSGTIRQVRYHPGPYASDAPQLRVEEFRERGRQVAGADRPVPTTSPNPG